ncbi:MAG: C4-dicarboxylate ABC transporter [Bacteroidetes bacterium]|nr:C4-dicarboxylate ABC transporter [Bacteroidota bacterium]
MVSEERNKAERRMTVLKAARHIVMGIIFWVFAWVMFNSKKFGAIELSTGVAYALGCVLVLYGGFRIWRGWADMKSS